MAFGSLLKDAQGVPIPQVYVPGVGFVALAGSTGSNTDGSSNASTGVNLNFNQVNNAALSGSNPVPTQDFIRTLILNGGGYSISAANTTGGAADPGLAIFNNSTAKNILIYSVMVVANVASTIGHSLRIGTADPALGTSVTPQLAKPGGAASGATCSSSNTQGTLVQSLLENFMTNTNTLIELFPNGRVHLLPAGAANSFTAQFVFGAAQSWLVRMLYVEY